MKNGISLPFSEGNREMCVGNVNKVTEVVKMRTAKKYYKPQP